MSEAGWARDQRVARLTFQPLRYNPARRELEVTQRLVVEVRFERSYAAGIALGRQRWCAWLAL